MPVAGASGCRESIEAAGAESIGCRRGRSGGVARLDASDVPGADCGASANSQGPSRPEAGAACRARMLNAGAGLPTEPRLRRAGRSAEAALESGRDELRC